MEILVFLSCLLVTGPLTELQIAFMCRETLHGLAYLHGMGKMHRDIKVINFLHSWDYLVCLYKLFHSSILIVVLLVILVTFFRLCVE